MKENEECKIVQDLLPIYIDNLTSKETDNFIKKHLQECEKCNNVCEKMKTEMKISDDIDRACDDEINYLKKYNKEIIMTVLRTISAILLVVVLVYVILVISRLSIINELSSKYEKYSKYDNIKYTEEVVNLKDHPIVLYRKNNLFKKVNEADGFYTWGNLDTGECYEFNDNNKTYKKKEYINFQVELDKPNFPIEENQQKERILYAMNLSKRINEGYVSKLTKEYCYILDSANTIGEQICIEKNTGLFIGNSGDFYGGLATRYKYEFGNVKDTDVEKPNINEYKLIDE